MAVYLPLYSQIKDNYCIVYLGACEEYLVQLKLLRPIIESQYPGINVYLCYSDRSVVIQDENKTLRYSELKDKKNIFAYIREISYKEGHPVEALLRECNINYYSLNTPIVIENNNCVISSKGAYPTRSLTELEIKSLVRMARSKGFSYVENCTNPGWVIGVENKETFLAAAKGIKTSLVATGLGTNLFKQMFPNQSIISGY